MYGFITSTNTLLFAAVRIWCSAQILWKLFIPRFDSYVIFLNLYIFFLILNQGCTVPICSLWFNWENISAQKSCSSFKIMSEVYTITFSWQFFKKKWPQNLYFNNYLKKKHFAMPCSFSISELVQLSHNETNCLKCTKC